MTGSILGLLTPWMLARSRKAQDKRDRIDLEEKVDELTDKGDKGG